jgi:RNA polymerase sigma-70 factor (ECF subfamily)
MAHPLLFPSGMMNTTLTAEPTPALAKTLAPEAFGDLYETHYALVHRVCYRYTKNPDEAADLAQEVFLKVHGNYGTFEGNSQASTWLYRVAANHCLDHLRWKKRQAELLIGYGEDLAANRVPEASPDNPAKRLFSRLLEGMDAANRQVVFLRFEVGLTHEEIAEICGVSRVAITKRLAKFHAKVALLKAELSDSLESMGGDFCRRASLTEDCED